MNKIQNYRYLNERGSLVPVRLCDLGHRFKSKEAPSPIARINIYPLLTNPVSWELHTFLQMFRFGFTDLMLHPTELFF